MTKKIVSLILGTVILLSLLTGCIQNNIGVKMNKDGTGSITVSIGIEKDFYVQLQGKGTDPFDGKETSEYTYENTTYVSYSETKEYGSYDEMEKALLEMTYDTELIEDAQQSQDDEMNGENEDFDGNGEDIIVIPDTEPAATETDNHIFSSVNIEKNSGIFYSSYTFNAVMNPQSNDGLDYDMNDAFKITLTVEMPFKITGTKGGIIDGNIVSFNIADITESQEITATCEENNTTVIIGITLIFVAIVAGAFCFIKSRK